MKTFVKLLVLVGVLSIAAVVQAQDVFTFDENGNGTFTPFGGPTIPLPFAPITGGGLIYTLPYPVSAGDVPIFEPTQTQPSDLVRFDNTAMLFFSLRDDNSPPDLADVAVFPTLGNVVAPPQIEVGGEGNNGVVYVGLAGFVGGPVTVGAAFITYNIISDIPEPSSVGLLAIGLALLGFRVWPRKVRP